MKNIITTNKTTFNKEPVRPLVSPKGSKLTKKRLRPFSIFICSNIIPLDILRDILPFTASNQVGDWVEHDRCIKELKEIYFSFVIPRTQRGGIFLLDKIVGTPVDGVQLAGLTTGPLSFISKQFPTPLDFIISAQQSVIDEYVELV